MRNTLAVGRAPETTNNFPPSPSWRPAVNCTAPVCSVTNCARSRPLRGSSVMVALSTSPPMLPFTVSTRGASPITSTVCVMAPTDSSKLTTAVRPTVRLIPLRIPV